MRRAWILRITLSGALLLSAAVGAGWKWNG